MPNFQAKVFVSLRPSVLDPAGEAAKSAATRLGLQGITSIRIGKAIELNISAPSEEEARNTVETISDRLLANPVIENWSFDLNQIDPSIPGKNL
ncbi:phosphoribosylformylglycinamidine synthase subunit PurS [Prochlorococcus marinus]|uniref:Phosphoribosylformylglycinamidine synthase subunit PurS n=1 Tax=Prochlorococcus marinus (strain MIT 9211) TaxID=93059 RepID=A9BAQ1_PROM4|nr:phosphoribosylformylglycinamidine synthase subunit PurS [Prochlorococcus marinus]ABX08913.1 Phosphoribosylformylglycinamidine synthetase PurS [Prochlorococcus marinus str. MIT 9211]